MRYAPRLVYIKHIRFSMFEKITKLPLLSLKLIQNIVKGGFKLAIFNIENTFTYY